MYTAAGNLMTIIWRGMIQNSEMTCDQCDLLAVVVNQVI